MSDRSVADFLAEHEGESATWTDLGNITDVNPLLEEHRDWPRDDLSQRVVDEGQSIVHRSWCSTVDWRGQTSFWDIEREATIAELEAEIARLREKGEPPCDVTPSVA